MLAPYQLPQMFVFSSIINKASQVIVGSKHTFVQYLTTSLMSEVSAGWRIAQRF